MLLKKYLHKLNEQEDISTSLVSFFTKNPNPSDDQVHDFSSKLGISPHKFEEKIYALLSEYVRGVGRHRDVSDSKFNKKELEMGIEVEKEHTDNPDIAKEIAKDHLAECADYYTRLDKMENECKKKG